MEIKSRNGGTNTVKLIDVRLALGGTGVASPVAEKHKPNQVERSTAVIAKKIEAAKKLQADRRGSAIDIVT